MDKNVELEIVINNEKPELFTIKKEEYDKLLKAAELKNMTLQEFIQYSINKYIEENIKQND